MAHPQFLPAVATALLGTAAAVSISHHFRSDPGALQLPDCAGSGVVAAKTDLKPTSAQVPGASLEFVVNALETVVNVVEATSEDLVTMLPTSVIWVETSDDAETCIVC